MPDQRLMIVKFYGPKRDSQGRLWGYARLFGAAEDLRVTEPQLGTDQLRDGTVVIADFKRDTQTERGLLSAARWEPNTIGVEVLVREMAWLRSRGEAVPSEFVGLITKVDPESLRVELLPWCTPRQITGWAVANPELIAGAVCALLPDATIPIKRRCELLQQAIVHTNWSAIRSEMTEESLGIFIGAVLSDDPSRLVALLPDEMLSELDSSATQRIIQWCTSRQITGWASAKPESFFDSVKTALADNEVPSTKRCGLALRVANAVGYPTWMAHLRDLNVASLVPESNDLTVLHLLDSADPEFVLDTPGLLKWPAPLALVSCSIALRSSNKSDRRTSPFLEYLESMFNDWVTAPGICDLRTGGARQAAILLTLHPSIARRLHSQGRLLPQVAHIVSCGEEISCCGVGPLASRAGHALSATIHVSQSRISERTRVRHSLAEALGSTKNTSPVDAQIAAVRWVFQQVIDAFNANEFDDPIGSMSLLLPPCGMGIVPFCEGKPATGTYTQPFCPRLGHGCDRGIVAPQRSGSKLSDWNLIDILGTAISDSGLELSGKTYVNTVAGWVNRLIELRERMVCRKCQSLLLVNAKYALKYEARYAVTVVDCSERCGEASVYLNHCFNCQNIIDSRESQYRYNRDTGELLPPGDTAYEQQKGFIYLCIHCANGMAPFCPNCGTASTSVEGTTTRVCPKCAHRVASSAVLGRNPRTAKVPQVIAPWDITLPSLRVHSAWEKEPSSAALRSLTETSPSGIAFVDLFEPF